MRRIITWEGRDTIPQVHIQKGALTWDKEPLPIHAQGGVTVLGLATDLRREEDGSITAELTFFDETSEQQAAKSIMEHGDMSTTIFAKPVTEKRRESPNQSMRYITAGRIRSIYLVLPHQVSWT